MPGGWQLWLDWLRAVAPDNEAEIKAPDADGRPPGVITWLRGSEPVRRGSFTHLVATKTEIG
jgi:hypothetical protein